MKDLFQEHIEIILGVTHKALEELKLPGLIIAAGSPDYYFEDDMTKTFKSNHHFRYFCPLEGDGHLLVIEPGKKPLLLAFKPDDFWHEITSFTANDFWVDSFDIKVFAKEKELSSFIRNNFSSYVIHSPQTQQKEKLQLKEIPEQLLHRLNWQRTIKSRYEEACLKEATIMAAQGHRAAKEAFLAGQSEMGIYYAYLQGTGLTEEELPYRAIIGLNEKAAILHYFKRRHEPTQAKSFLIDAGAQIHGYASDISRTYAHPEAHEVFQALITDVDEAQQSLCQMVKPGIMNTEIHAESLFKIAKILTHHKIIQGMDNESIVETGLIQTFYPHGIGHLLGLHVHDVGGHMKNSKGDKHEFNPLYPTLRSQRKLDAGNYLTIEPGLYFIDMLLDKQKDSQLSKHLDWSLIELLKPFGGIRIEDNILVTENGMKNITRDVLT